MQQDNPVDNPVDNYLAAIFTMMLPGLGQMLQKRIILGLFFSVMVGGGYLLNGWFGLGVHVICILDSAFYGKEVFTTQNAGKKGVMFVGLALLLVYTCLRTALF